MQRDAVQGHHICTAILQDPLGVLGSVCNLKVCDAMQGECRVLLESSKLQHNTAINGGAFFAASTPCFMVSPYIALPQVC